MEHAKTTARTDDSGSYYEYHDSLAYSIEFPHRNRLSLCAIFDITIKIKAVNFDYICVASINSQVE
jgi:hypothetical protein